MNIMLVEMGKKDQVFVEMLGNIILERVLLFVV